VQGVPGVRGEELRRQAHALIEERRQSFLEKPLYSDFEDTTLRDYFVTHLNATYYRERVYVPNLYEVDLHAALQRTAIRYICG
jgi:hypothetical protein